MDVAEKNPELAKQVIGKVLGGAKNAGEEELQSQV